jgi:putative ATP-binding cassette transporter
MATKTGHRGVLRDAWAIARPYWMSEAKWSALGLLSVIVALSLGQVALSVRLNYWRNAFYNTLQNLDEHGFYVQIGIFAGLATLWVLVGTSRAFLNQMLRIRWRRWLTDLYLQRWLDHRAYYRLQLTGPSTDNPDQRIAEDLNLFVANTLSLGLGLLSSVVTLVSFVAILWTLSGGLTVLGVTIPGYMVWVAILYAGAGSWITHVIGKSLIGLEFNQQRFEADYRFSLVRLRENSEGVALYRGEPEELGNFRGRFANVISNWWGIMRKQKQLNFFTIFYAQVAVIFPFVVAAPRYFSGAIQLGGLMQISSAFSQVQGALSWFIDAYPQFANWKATVDRLTGFAAALEAVREESGRLEGQRDEGAAPALRLDALELDLPQGAQLLSPTTIELAAGEHVLITGPSGAGKSTLFRTLAGIWPYWRGRIRLPQGARLLFLPQKPYLPIGTLKHAVAYPDKPSSFSDLEAGEALEATGLGHFALDLQRSENWAQVLSGGEQQRLAFARALLNKPDWLFLDEATASLPESAQHVLYRLLREKLPRTTLVSISHRESLAAEHPRHLAWQDHALASVG